MPISTDKKWLKGRSKFMTGFCNDYGKPGQHEGQKPRSGNKPLPTCAEWQTCPCNCHKMIDDMFEMTKMERRLVPNPEYAPQHDEFVMPEVVIDPLGVVASSGYGVTTPPDDERAVTVAPGPVAAPLAQRRSPLGYAARGALEAQVWDACFNMPGDDDLTPKQVSEWIAEKYKVPTPSTGAINAAWERWVKLGFCELGKKPNRFLGFCNAGTWEELQKIKASKKRQEKSSVAAAKRTIRQPEKRKR